MKAADGDISEIKTEFGFTAQKLKAKESALTDFCEQTNLRRDRYREQVFAVDTEKKIANFGRSTSSKAVWANKKALTNGENGGIIKAGKTDSEVQNVHYIGKIDKDIYKCITEDIRTDEVIITDTQIQHIKDRHPTDYEKYFKYAEQIVKEPDYILEANKPNTAFILKHISDDKKSFEMILRLQTSDDPESYKNSVITFLQVGEKRYKRYLRTKKILYKSE